MRYVEASLASADTMYNVPESNVGDLAVHYEYGPFRAAANLTNVTDETYVASALFTSCYDAERRGVIGSLAYRW